VRRVRIAVVGTGFGARIHVPGLRASGRFEVAALVGRDLDRTRATAERLGVPAACTSLDEALGSVALDAVSIATPPATHAPFAIAAARAGKHVLCEKPMARSVAEASAMCEAVRANRVVGAIGFEAPGDMLREQMAHASTARLRAAAARALDMMPSRDVLAAYAAAGAERVVVSIPTLPADGTALHLDRIATAIP